MKFKNLLFTLTLGLSVSTVSLANEINSSWDVRSLKAHSISSIVKSAKNKKYSTVIITKSNSNKKTTKSQQTYSNLIFNLFNFKQE